MDNSHSLAAAILTVVALYLLVRNLSHRASLPPGLPPKDPFKVYQSWSKSYESNVIYMHIFGHLFDKRSSKYSTRPRLVMAGELVGQDQSLLFLKYGTKWKQCRQVGTIQNYASMQENEDFSQHIRHTAGSTLLKLTYGIECQAMQDPWIGMAEDLCKITAVASQPGRCLLTLFQSVRPTKTTNLVAFTPMFFPGTGFLRWAELSRKVVHAVVRKPFEKIEEEMLDGTAKSSWVLENMIQEGRKKTEEEKDVLICSAGSLYAGGIDTVSGIVQRRAQAEIDSVIGSDRLPNMNDRPLLPYVAALIREVYRINAVAPLVPHSLDEDDIYEGRRIPKGAVLHDAAVYHDPECFDPSRYEATPDRNAEPDPTGYAFGIGMGRRFCPGIHYAEAAVFINIVQVLSVFNISPALDVKGEKVIPSFEFNVGHLRTPKPFNCRIEPRSQTKIELVRHALAE
ncbi:cytochrome P450 [Mycena epipterygia]|nr:cytochrome P450 [Mycena epipterygia]